MHLFYKVILCGAILFCSVLLSAQSLENIKVTSSFEQQSLPAIFAEIEQQYPVTIYYRTQDIPDTSISRSFTSIELTEVIADLLSETNLTYLPYRYYGLVILPRSFLAENYTADYFQILEERVSGSEATKKKEPDYTVGSLRTLQASGKALIQLQIVDDQTQEPIIGATAFFPSLQLGSSTDVNGGLALEIPSGTYELTVQYVGYQEQILSVAVIGDGELRLTLEKEAIKLQEVLVKAEAVDVNVESAQIGVEQLDVKSLNKLPSFLGEVDVVRSLLLQPGVSTIGEGAIGFNVRGGEVDQNLIMQDEGMLFNSSHALGFFSTFNPELISFVTLYKGSIPAQFGGRLASALEVEMRDGSFEKYRVKGGAGLVSSKISFEGPVIKEKSSLITGFRASYSDWVLRLVQLPEIRRSSANFYDLNLRYTHRIDEKNILTVSGYNSNDRFIYNDLFGFDYSTKMAQAIYRKTFSEKLFSKFSFTASRYESTQLDLDGTDASDLENDVTYYKIKGHFIYSPSRLLQWDAGISSIFYQLAPGTIRPNSPLSQVIAKTLENEQGLETAAFLNAAWTWTPAFRINAGLRLVAYQYLGPKTTYSYADSENPSLENLLSSQQYNSGEVIASYASLEPRISMRYRLGPSTSVKAGYSRTAQFINLIANTNSPTPSSQWQLSTEFIEPQRSHNFSIGYFRNFKNNVWETSLETYFRAIDHLFDYKDFADLRVNEQLETELLPGIGRAYGLEFGIRKRSGKVNGSFNYTLSRTERKVAGVNEKNWYPSNFDKPHDLSVVFNIQPSIRHTITFNFVYSTGRPTTAPFASYKEDNNLIVPVYSDRNQLRIPDYHRLDVAYTMGQSLKVTKKIKTSWTVSLYNLYGRDNAFSVFFTQKPFQAPTANKLSILGNIFPAITFNFETI